MRQVVVVDKGDYWHIIADYSSSQRHSPLSALEWQNEYATHPSYAAMRSSQPGSTGILSKFGVGRWKKDWSGPWVPPTPTAT